jgi:hypothetical protein
MMRASFDADASKLYRQSNQAIFLFLMVGSERILVRDNYRGHVPLNLR